MNIKTPFRYMGRELLRSVGMFYAIFISFTVVITLFLSGFSTGGTLSGIEVGSSIFLFVVGLNTFTEYFGMLLQNGVSRKTFFVSRLLAFTCTAGLVVLGDTIFSMALRLIYAPQFDTYTTFQMLYPPASASPGPLFVVASLLFNFMMSFLLLNVGACIVTMFYRLPNPFKAIVGAGVPILLLIGFPYIDDTFFGNKISQAICRGLDFAFGFSSGRPYMGVITLTALSALFILLGWLLTRRATFRK